MTAANSSSAFPILSNESSPDNDERKDANTKKNDVSSLANVNNNDTQKNKVVPSSSSSIRSYMIQQIIKPVWVSLSFGTVALVASSVSNQALLKCLGQLVDTTTAIGGSSSRSSSSTTTGNNLAMWKSVGIVIVGGATASFIRTTSLAYANETIITKLRYDIFRSCLLGQLQKSQSSSNSETNADDNENTTVPNGNNGTITGVDDDPYSPAVITTILQDPINAVSKMITSSIPNLFRGMLSITFSSYKMIVMDSYLFGISLATVPLIGFSAIRFQKYKKKLVGEQQQLQEQLNEYVIEKLNNLDLIHLSAREQDEITTYQQQIQQLQSLGQRIAYQNGYMMGFLFLSSASSLIYVLYQGTKRSQQNYTTTNLPSFLSYTFLLGLGTSSVTKSLSEFSIGMKSLQRLHTFLVPADVSKAAAATSTTLQHGDATSSAPPTNLDTVRAVTLQNVSFGYRTNKLIVKNVTLSLQRGNVVAIVGKNGSGKSTCTKLLTGLYTPAEGQVVVELTDGTLHPLSEFRTKNSTTSNGQQQQQQQQLVQIIPQQIGLFNTSILENVRYCQPNATIEEVYDVLQRANCMSFVTELPNGIETIIGRNGRTLSGGQQQRLALARALLCSPVVLLMDEPNNNLDNDGIQAIHEAISYCQQSNIALGIITHDPTTIQRVDTIIVIDNGIVIEQGTYSELVNNNKSALCQLMPSILLQ